MVQHERSILGCSLIFLTFVGWVHSGETKCVSAGDTRLLFLKSDTSFICMDVFLYINGIKDKILIGSWKWKNGIFEEAYMKPDYKQTIVIDRDGNIWILNVNINDAGKYILQCDNQKTVSEVELKLSEEVMECQHDATFMKKHSENSSKEALLQMQNRLEDVCRKSDNSSKEALLQMQNRLEDVCKKCGSSDGMLISIHVMTVLILVGVLAVMFITGLYLYRQKKNKHLMKEEMLPLLNNNKAGLEKCCEAFKEKQTIPIQEIRQLWTESFENFKEQTMPLMERDLMGVKEIEHLMKEEMLPLLNNNQAGLEKCCEAFKEKQTIPITEIHQLWTESFENLKREQIALLEQNRLQRMKHFDKLKWEEILKLLNHDQQKELQSYCNDLTFRKIRELENKKLGESWNYDTSIPVMEQGAQNNSSQALGSGPFVDINESKGTSQK